MNGFEISLISKGGLIETYKASQAPAVGDEILLWDNRFFAVKSILWTTRNSKVILKGTVRVSTKFPKYLFE